MEFSPGTIMEGTVRSIAAFGAFINLPEGKTGLVHISEVSSSYVTDIRQHLTEGQTVRVKLLNTDDRGRLSLSIKQAEERPAGEAAPVRRSAEDRPAPRPQSFQPIRTEPESFEEKLKQFMADSNSKISGVRQYEHKTRSRKR
ncbi:MAG: S1 RNA-binding domain-containing protein [Oscillospiraceae bacterium]|nr:S1 RNA-binding domain-containing protein [Oscillospiraceae bacterium]